MIPARLALAIAGCSLLGSLLGAAGLAGQGVDPSQVQDLYGHSVHVAEETARKVPGFSKPIFDLGKVHQRFQFDDRALEAYRQGLRLDPDHPEILSRMGFILSQINRMDEALKCYRDGLRLNPTEPDLHSRIGLILVHQGRLPEAVEEFRAEIQNRTASAMTYYVLGGALRDLRKLPEALRSYKEALRMEPHDTTALYGISQVHKLLGNREEELKALEGYQKWKAKEDESLREGTKKGGNRDEQLRLTALGYVDAAETYVMKDMKEDAEEALRTAILFDPSKPGVQRLLVDILRQEQKIDQALVEGQRLLASTREVSCLYLVAGLFIERRLFPEAAQLLEEAVLKAPKEGDSYRELARLILKNGVRGDSKRAVELARKAVESSPGDAMNYDVYGWALSQSGDPAAAVEALATAVRLEPANEPLRRRYEELKGKAR